MADIFISYASEDRERIKPLVELFEEQSWSVWWDGHIGTGESFDRVIESEIEAASCVLVVWSSHSVESRWVRNEASEGLERDILAPVLIEQVKPPLAFRSTHAVELIGWPHKGHKENITKLLIDVSQIIGAEDTGSMSTRQVDPSTTRSSEVVLAILPLTDLTEEQSMGYICDGLAEDLMDALFQFDQIRVLSGSATFSYRNSQAGTRDIGLSLNATMVIEGSVRHSGDRIVVNARLIEVANGLTLYSERFVHNFDDPIEIQSTIARKVFDGLREHLGVTEPHHVDFDPTSRNPLAYDIYQRAQSGEDKKTLKFHAQLERVAMLECAIALDPEFERAYADLAIDYVRVPAVVTRRGAKARATKLLADLRQLRPNSRVAWAIEVELESNMSALAQRCVQAITQGEGVHAYPHPTGWHDVRAGLARALAHSGLHREGFDYFALLDRKGEPNRYDNWLHQLGCLVAVGDFDQAIAHAKKMRNSAREPGPLVPAWEFVALIASNQMEAARLLLPELAQWRIELGERVLGMIEGKEIPALKDGADSDADAYGLLAANKIDQGLSLLESAIEQSDATDDRHWISYRLPIYRHLFSNEVTQHARYRKIVNALRLDADSRTQLQRQVAELSAITGIESAPLIEI